MIKAVAFDLDNTLYDHSLYVKSAYHKISNFVAQKYNLNSSFYEKWIFGQWIKKGSSYNKIFEESYQYFGLNGFYEDIGEILELYHHAEPELIPYEGTYEALNLLSGKYMLILITDGQVLTQEYKIKNLKLNKYFEKIYISGAFGKEYYKPSTKMFKACLKDHGIKADEVIYVGDNPYLDYLPCNSMKIQFIRLRKGEYKNQSLDGIISIDDISELPLIIERKCGK